MSTALHPSAIPSESARPLVRRAHYIVSPVYDWLFFLAPPVVSLLIGIAISGTSFATETVDFHGYEMTLSGIAIGIFIHAHIFAVFFRSHANGDIFETHRIRFVLVPMLLFGAMILSSWVLVACSVLATFWDVYHSGLQTFGFGRLYDRKQGNSAEAGRTLDLWLNSLFYAGPILGGATMLDHFEDFEEFESVGATFFTQVPAIMTSNQVWFAYGVIAFGTVFTAYYLYAYWQLQKQGYAISWLKTWLYASTRDHFGLYLGIQQLRGSVLHHEPVSCGSVFRLGLVVGAGEPAAILRRRRVLVRQACCARALPWVGFRLRVLR